MCKRVLQRTARRVAAAGILFIAAGCATAPAPGPAEIDPDARAAIDRMCAAMDGLDTYSLTVVSTTDEPLESGQLVQVGRTTEITVARPDRMVIRVKRDSGERWTGWLNGGVLVLLDQSESRWARIELPAVLDEALVELGDRYGLYMPLGDIVSGVRRQELLHPVLSGMHVATEEVAGTLCDQLLFRQDVADWQIWIAADEPSLPRKIAMVYKDEPGNPGYQALISRWDLAPTLDAAAWKPDLPAMAQEVSFDELVSGE